MARKYSPMSRSGPWCLRHNAVVSIPQRNHCKKVMMMPASPREPVAKYTCPICRSERCTGHFPETSFWTSRCWRCQTYYRYGTIDSQDQQIDIRCPSCHRLQMRGVFPPGSWATMRCKCREFLYFINSVAYIAKFGEEVMMQDSPAERADIDYWASVEVEPA